jgi:hypothetical protein
VESVQQGLKGAQDRYEHGEYPSGSGQFLILPHIGPGVIDIVRKYTAKHPAQPIAGRPVIVSRWDQNHMGYKFCKARSGS